MKKTLVLVSFVVAMMGAGEAMGVPEYEWDGATSGSVLWNDAANWNITANPEQQTTGYPYYDDYGRVVIADTITGDRDITMSGPIFMDRFHWTANGAYENRLTLGGDVKFYDPHQTGFLNPSKDATQMVLDLNGHTFDSESSWFLVPDMTIEGPGTFMVSGTGVEFSAVANSTNPADWTTPVFGPDVTFKAMGSFRSHDATIANLGTAGDLTLTNGITVTGDLTADHRVTFASALNLIQGDINVDGGNASAGLHTNSGVSAGMSLAGSIIDHNTAQNGLYNSGRLMFVGGGNEQTLDVRRQSDMRLVIEAGSHVVLGSDYYAPYDGSTTWVSGMGQGAILDVSSHVLTLTDLQAEWNGADAEAPTFRLEANGSSGVINILGDLLGDSLTTGLALKKFHVEIAASGGWTSGADFVLFNYGDQGTNTLASYAPDLLSVTLPGPGWSYDSFVDTGSQLVLTNMVPEPVSLVLMGLGSLALLRRRRR